MAWTKAGVWYDNEAGLRPASPRVLDFRNCKTVKNRRDEDGLMRNVIYDDRPTIDNPWTRKGSAKTGVLTTPTQVRARARRARRSGLKNLAIAADILYKPLDEWDDEELARGKPRTGNGDFRGPTPKFITREIHEAALERFRGQVRAGMNASSLKSLAIVDHILEEDEVDHRGKPVIPYSTKLDAAKYLLDHVVGKSKQPVAADISVRLQGILASVMVNPDESANHDLDGYSPAYVGMIEQGVIDAEVEEDEDG